MRFGVCKSDMIMLIMKEACVRKSHVFELLAMETRGETSTERRGKKIYAVFFVGLGVGKLLGKRCCVKYYP